MLTHIINDIRNLIGRDITFYTVASSIPCPTCDLNPVTQEATDPFCPTCSGVYFIPIYSGLTVPAHITWGKADRMNWVTGGQFFEGDCRAQIEYNDTSLYAAKNAKYVVVDNIRMTVNDIGRRGVPDLNRLVLTLNEEE